nr:hypothetical protein CFP56_41472 [Quercus suber]
MCVPDGIVPSDTYVVLPHHRGRLRALGASRTPHVSHDIRYASLRVFTAESVPSVAALSKNAAWTQLASIEATTVDVTAPQISTRQISKMVLSQQSSISIVQQLLINVLREVIYNPQDFLLFDVGSDVMQRYNRHLHHSLAIMDSDLCVMRTAHVPAAR